jgi:hypothetical protein
MYTGIKINKCEMYNAEVTQDSVGYVINRGYNDASFPFFKVGLLCFRVRTDIR